MWAAGDTLSFVLIEDTVWLDGYPNLAAVEAFIETQMTVWSGISTADIQWDIGSTAAGRDPATSGVHIDDEPGGRGGTRHTSREGRIQMCDIHLPSYRVTRSRQSQADFFIHELGHCVGLHHAGVFWPSAISGYRGELPSAWSADPMMSYGDLQGEGRLTSDDRIGVSLLRPAMGWKAGTGGIRGSVLIKRGGDAAFVHVIATKLDANGDMVESIGGFTNIYGEFLLEGLAPGPYSLLARTITEETAHPGKISVAEADLRDALQTASMSVQAGQTAGPVAITVRRGEYPW